MRDYFDQPSAAEGDHILRAEVDRGTVPGGCLLAGFIVAAYRMNGDDPCLDCPGPRERCLGRPARADRRDQATPPDLHQQAAGDNESAATRKDRRRITIEQLWRIAQQRLADRKTRDG